MITFQEAQAKLEFALAAPKLAEAIDRSRSQLLDLSEYSFRLSSCFVELVLKDGSKLAEGRRAITGFEQFLTASGVQAECIIRAVWKLQEVWLIGPAISPTVGFVAATSFGSRLTSGEASCQVQVDVSYAAMELLRGGPAVAPGAAPLSVERAIEKYLQSQLSHGGESYWDPTRFSRLELNELAMQCVCMRN